MADLDNMQIWKVEEMQGKEVQGSKSNLIKMHKKIFKVFHYENGLCLFCSKSGILHVNIFVVIRFSYQDW
jgi:hypothetical protein